VKTFVCAFPNDKSTRGRRPCRYCDESHEVAEFAELWNKDGWAIYSCRNPLIDNAEKDGQRGRRIETVAEIVELFVDIDVLRDLDDTPANVFAQLETLSCPASDINNSGGGFHVSWTLDTPIKPGTSDFYRAQQLYRDLAEVLCADPTCSHPAALLRVVGTHNSKRGTPILVERVGGTGDPVSLHDLDEMVMRLRGRARPMFVKRGGDGRDNGHVMPSIDGLKPPVDLDAPISLHGAGGHQGVHEAELTRVASRLRKGMSLDEAVTETLRSVYENTKEDTRTKDWNPVEERIKVEKQGLDHITKRVGEQPYLIDALPEDLREKFKEAHWKGLKPWFKRVGGAWQIEISSEPSATREYRFRLVPYAEMQMDSPMACRGAFTATGNSDHLGQGEMLEELPDARPRPTHRQGVGISRPARQERRRDIFRLRGNLGLWQAR
jgi:hypothetical protein